MNIFRTISVLLLTPLAFVACNTTPSSTGGTGGWSPDDATIDGLEITSVVPLGAQESAVLEIETDASWELGETASWLEPRVTFGTGNASVDLRGIRDEVPPGSYETVVDVTTASGTARAKVTMRFPSVSGTFVDEIDSQSASTSASISSVTSLNENRAAIQNNTRVLGPGNVHVVLSGDAMGTESESAQGNRSRNVGPPANALKNLPDVAKANIENLVSKFQSANEGGLGNYEVVDAARGWVTIQANERGKALANLRGETTLVGRAGPDLDQRLPPPEDQEGVSTGQSLKLLQAGSMADQQNHVLIETEQAHANLNGLGESVTVAIIDSAVDVDHLDLDHVTFNDGYNFVHNIPQAVSPEHGPHYHGTHVAGIVAASLTKQSSEDLAFGVSPDVSVVPITVLSNQGTGSTTNVARAILYAAGDCVSNSAGDTVCGPQNVDVINLSLGPVIPSEISTCAEAEANGYLDENAFMESALQYAASQGVLVVAAAGNDSLDCFGWPAASEHALAISAAESGGDALTDFSNRSSSDPNAAPIFLGAPGRLIESLYPAASYGVLSGTSMATPHVAGVAALVKGNDPSLEAPDIAVKLACNVTADSITRSETEFGAGLLNAFNAVTDASTANPYASLTVDVDPPRGEVTVTEYGSFTIANLPAGTYRLTVEDYTSEPITIDYTGDVTHVRLPIGSFCGN